MIGLLFTFMTASANGEEASCTAFSFSRFNFLLWEEKHDIAAAENVYSSRGLLAVTWLQFPVVEMYNSCSCEH